jgi:hypothetical protein
MRVQKVSYYSYSIKTFPTKEIRMTSNHLFLFGSEWLNHQVTPWRFSIALAAAVLCQIAMLPLDHQLHLLSGNMGKPSLVFGASAMGFFQQLTAFGEQGRSILTKLYAIDLVFPTTLALAAIQGYWLAFRHSAPVIALVLGLIAILFDLLDLLEKLSSFMVLNQFPRIGTSLLTFTVTITSLKLICLAIVYAGLVAAGLSWGAAVLRH